MCLGSVAASQVLEAPLGAREPNTKPAVSQFVLSNGLQVLLEEDHRQKLVAIRMTYAIGSRDEPKAQRGIAHLVEHLTFRGSRHLKDDEMSALFQLAGAGDMNGETSADETSYHETVSSGALALGLWLERERMAFTVEQFNVQALRSEQAILHREEATRKGEDGTLIMALLNAMSGDHRPYAEWTDDSPSVSKLTLQDVRSFFCAVTAQTTRGWCWWVTSRAQPPAA